MMDFDRPRPTRGPDAPAPLTAFLAASTSLERATAAHLAAGIRDVNRIRVAVEWQRWHWALQDLAHAIRDARSLPEVYKALGASIPAREG